jgi:hypothetical protein
MKYLITPIFLLLITAVSYSQLPQFEWANQLGNPPNTTDTKTSLAHGQDGSFFLAGEFLDTVQFGNKIMVSAGGTDIFLAKYDADGDPLWSNRIGAADFDFVRDIISDDEGNVIISGIFYGTTQIGQDQYTSYGSQDIFLAKFDAAGAFLWSYRAGGAMADYITGLSLDADQNIVVAGYFYDGISFGDTLLPASSSSDIFVARFNAGGELLWVNTAGGSSSDQLSNASVDTEGRILLAGSFYYDITLGDTTLSTTNPVGVFIARYLPDGQLDQVFQLEGTYLTTDNYVVAGQDGEFYISGNFSEQLVFGSKTFDAGEFNQDIYFAKYSSTCKLQWARHAFSFGSDQVMGIETDDFNNLYLTGHYLDTIHFDLLTIPYTLCCGSREIFIVSYNATGDALWGEQIIGTRANVQSLAMNSQGDLLLSGLFSEEVSMGNLVLSHFDGFQNYVTCLKTEIYTAAGPELRINSPRIFPNPSTGKIRILTTHHEGRFNYLIFNVKGDQVVNGTAYPNNDIDVSKLPAGHYFVRVITHEGNSACSSAFIKY